MPIDNSGYSVKQLSVNQERTREGLRRRAVLVFLDESPGTRYHYVIETLTDGRRIYLRRPGWKNKGFDFEIWVEDWNPGHDRRPSHKDIFADLASKKHANPSEYGHLSNALQRVYACEEPDDIIQSFTSLRFASGMSIEIILKVLKWLFIEQDITYWNGQGRNMLKKAIDKV